MGWKISHTNIELLNNSAEISRLFTHQKKIIDQIHDAVIVTDIDGKITNWNSGAENMFGYSSEEIYGQFIYILFPSIKRYEIFQDKYIDYLVEHGFDEYEAEMKKKNGERIYVETSSSLLTDDDENVEGVISYTKDISKRKRIEGKYKKSKDRHQLLYDHTPTMFFSLNDKGEILNVNEYGAEQLGYSLDELVGKHLIDITHNDEKEKITHFLEDCINDNKVIHRCESLKICKDGNILNVRETARIVEDRETNQYNILLVCEDVTKSIKLYEHLSYQASHDNLTNLLNRRQFEHRLQLAIDSAYSDRATHVLCYIDLDQFKIINDTCGHMAGDVLLVQISLLMKKHISKRDILARLGGDEFGLLLSYCNSESAVEVITQLQYVINDFVFKWGDHNFRIGMTTGMVNINQNTNSVIDVLKKADSACFVAKDSGRNRYHIYEESDLEISRRQGEIQWVSRIHNAFENNLFSLNIQEITPVRAEDKGEHYEVLIRMTEGEKIIPPGAFMPAAERYNLSPKIDSWVINETFRWLINNPDKLEKLSLCSINLSGNSLSEKDFLEFVTKTLKETKIPPEKICFEITETAAIANLNSAIEFINKVKEFGCYFALDDFGSGLSSFGYLKNLQVDILKIDGIFVKDIAEDTVDFAMVKSINEIGHVMGKETVAEFVENKEILKKLEEIGVDYAQGYYFSKPHPISDYESLANVG